MPSLSLTSVDTDTTLVAEATPDELLPVLLPEMGESVTLSYDDIRITTDYDVRVVPAEDPPGGDTTGCSGDVLNTSNSTALTWSPTLLDAAAGPTTTQAYLPTFYIRPASAGLRTRLVVSGTPTGLAWDHLHAYAIDCGGTRLLTGTSISDGVFEFSPAVATSVCGFELELDDDVDSDTVQSIDGDYLEAPSNFDIDDNDNHVPATVNLTIGNTYAAYFFASGLMGVYHDRATFNDGSCLHEYYSTRYVMDISNGTSFTGGAGVETDETSGIFCGTPTSHVSYLDLPTGGLGSFLTADAGYPPGTLSHPTVWDGVSNLPRVGSLIYFTAAATKVNVRTYTYPNAGAGIGITFAVALYNATFAPNRQLSLGGGGGGGSTVDNTCTYAPGQVDMEIRSVGLLTESVVPAYIVVTPEEL